MLTRVLFDDFSDLFIPFVESHATCKIYDTLSVEILIIDQHLFHQKIDV